MTGTELRQLRKEAGLTQQELGERLGLEGPGARSRIYDYESERRGITPGLGMAFKLIFKDLQK